MTNHLPITSKISDHAHGLCKHHLRSLQSFCTHFHTYLVWLPSWRFVVLKTAPLFSFVLVWCHLSLLYLFWPATSLAFVHSLVSFILGIAGSDYDDLVWCCACSSAEATALSVLLHCSRKPRTPYALLSHTCANDVVTTQRTCPSFLIHNKASDAQNKRD